MTKNIEQSVTQDPDELDPRDFISEGDDYAAHVRFHKYDEETIAASDVLCYQIELARERLLLLEIKIARVSHTIKILKGDLKTIKQMEMGIIIPIAFGIDPTSILQSQLAEQESILQGYIKRANVARSDLNRCYNDIMCFWDVAYDTLLNSPTPL